ncbi:MAG TPA: LuxR C-terminal-related transcriptional regulator [Acidimicrobiia bacterium]|jgi:DNA-binding NarL/FixJ family response regulator
MALQEISGPLGPRFTTEDPIDEPVPQARVVTYLRRGIFADAIENLMEQDRFDVVAADDLDSLVELAISADGCIVDMAMHDAATALTVVAQARDDLRVVVLANARTKHVARVATRSARLTYVSTDDSLDRVLAFLRGETVHFERHLRPERARSHRHSGGRDPQRLTTREAEILEGLLDGDNTKVLAARLGVSQATARTHVQSVLSKLGVHSRLEAVALVNGNLGGMAIDLFDPASRRSS